jgi:lipopolysaccharide biosynthesis glycosyltransferase
MIPIFIGYDPREAIAFHVCHNSIVRHSSQPISVNALALNILKGYEEKHTVGSNHFIYSRFLVPHLMNYQGWAIFIDGDMLLRDDIVKLWNLKDESKAVMVVKHDYKTKMTQKYLGSKNENYPRKNWSSVILWNCSHPANKCVTPEFIQNATGAQVHRFSWLQDDQIGELPKEWNWLDIEYDFNEHAKLVHYTLGSPCFQEFANQGSFSNEWHKERILTEFCQQRNL